MGLFKRLRRTEAGAVISDRDASRADQQALREFADSRAGVEAYFEPPTTTTAPTLLLVAADGEWTRRRITSARHAFDLASSLALPLYDATKVGYPQRMRDYSARMAEQGRRATVNAPRASRSPAELAAVATLQSAAGGDPVGPDPSREQLERLWKAARVKAHPDRRGGDRAQWDEVEAAAQRLGLLRL